MTQMKVPEDFFPAALRKIFYETDVGPLSISIEEVSEARRWKANLDRDIMAIQDGLAHQ